MKGAGEEAALWQQPRGAQDNTINSARLGWGDRDSQTSLPPVFGFSHAVVWPPVEGKPRHTGRHPVIPGLAVASVLYVVGIWKPHSLLFLFLRFSHPLQVLNP